MRLLCLCIFTFVCFCQFSLFLFTTLGGKDKKSVAAWHRPLTNSAECQRGGDGNSEHECSYATAQTFQLPLQKFSTLYIWSIPFRNKGAFYQFFPNERKVIKRITYCNFQIRFKIYSANNSKTIPNRLGSAILSTAYYRKR